MLIWGELAAWLRNRQGCQGFVDGTYYPQLTTETVRDACSILSRLPLRPTTS